MSIFAILQIAIKSLLKNKTRSFLTMLGIIIGVGAVITMIAIGQGAKKIVDDQINSMGTNVINVFSNNFGRSGARSEAGSGSNLKVTDAETFKQEIKNILYASPVLRTGGQIKFQSYNWRTSVQGVDVDFFDIRNFELESGEFFTSNDVKSGNKVCVIGKTVADNIFPNDDPIGKMIRVRSVPLKVTGVLKSKGQNAMGNDQDDVLIAPYTTVQSRLSGHWQPMVSIIISATSKDKIETVQNEVKTYLLSRQRTATEDDFTIRSQTDIAETSKSVSNTLTILLASIAGISLLVGGIGIMNIMLVSVTERIKEIGLRMAVGANKKDVLMQFVIEAVMISIMGGIIGILLGYACSSVVGHIMKWNTSITLWSVVLSVGFSGFIGVFFGWYPARKAANLNLIDALRYE